MSARDIAIAWWRRTALLGDITLDASIQVTQAECIALATEAHQQGIADAKAYVADAIRDVERSNAAERPRDGERWAGVVESLHGPCRTCDGDGRVEAGVRAGDPADPIVVVCPDCGGEP